MKRYIRASELISRRTVENYRGYPITLWGYGNLPADFWEKGSDGRNFVESEQYAIGYDKSAYTFNTIEEARAFIDELL